MKILFYILREIYQDRFFSFLFVLNLALGLTGFISLNIFKNSLESSINSQSKEILGADLGFSARRPITESELQIVEDLIEVNFKKTQLIESYSMVANTKGNSRLVEIRAIEKDFPFYGEIKLETKGIVDERTFNNLNESPKVWISPELLIQLNLSLGDQLIIGESVFEVDDLVLNDIGIQLSTGVAPRIYVSVKQLKKTQLLKLGSVARYSYLFYLPQLSNDQLNDYKDQIFKKMDQSDIRVYSHKDSGQQMSVLVRRLNDFLGLSSLVALFLAGIGAVFLFQSHFRQKIVQVGILISLGLARWKAFLYHWIQLLILGFLSSIIATLFSFFGLPLFHELTQNLLSYSLNINYDLSVSIIALNLVIGTIASSLICLPVLVDIFQFKPALLFINSFHRNKRTHLLKFISWIPLFVLFWILSIFLSYSFWIGSFFTLLFFSSILLLGLFSLFVFRILNLILNKWTKFLSFRWGLRNLVRKNVPSMACFLSIGMGMALLNLVPQLQYSFEQEFVSSENSVRPDLFLFDLQEDQVSDFKQIISEKKGVTINQMSPLIRARLIKVNDELFDKGIGASGETLSREEEAEMRFRNRGFNLTYRNDLTPHESLTKGVGFSFPSNEDFFEISLEKRFADRLHLKIGDRLSFDIEGVVVEGKVVNFRHVQWSSFQPNFFVLFQSGALEDAPKTYLVTFSTQNKEVKEEIQSAIVRQIPNVSIIDVSRLINTLSYFVNQMSFALQVMSLLCVIIGFMVVFSIANDQANRNRWEVGLLKSLGASYQTIRLQFLIQYGIISLLSSVVGVLIGFGMSYFISWKIFESLWKINLVYPILSVVFVIIMTVFIVDQAIKSALKTKVTELFSRS